jgi:3-(3-hydroxy-phenyl)propionate hydroxylase
MLIGAQRYLGDAPAAVYLLRPDQHVAARWPSYNEPEIRAALLRATAQG